MEVKITKNGKSRLCDLAYFLRPTYTGSAQGTVEQLQAEISMLKETIGNLMAHMVETKHMTLEQAVDMVGMHQAYREYFLGEIELMP